MNKLLSGALDSVMNTMQAQRVHANNLANVSTSGFRSDYMNVVADMQTQQEGQTLENSVELWSDASGGALMQTGRTLDLAIEGEGWFAVQDAAGEEAYTRLGSMEIDQDGVLRTSSGLPVVGDGGPMVLPPYEQMVIGNDGRISIKMNGAANTQLAEVGFLKMVNPPAETMVKGEDGLFRLDTAEMAPQDAAVSVVSGYLEGSNVSAVKEMVSFLNLSRNFEMHMKTITSSEKVAESNLKMIQA